MTTEKKTGHRTINLHTRSYVCYNTSVPEKQKFVYVSPEEAQRIRAQMEKALAAIPRERLTEKPQIIDN